MWVYIRLTFITFTTFTQLLVLIYPKFKLRNIDLMVWMKQVLYGFVNSVIFRSDLMTELTNDWKVDTWPCFSLETKTVPCTNLVFCQMLVISVTTKICKIIFTLVLYFFIGIGCSYWHLMTELTMTIKWHVFFPLQKETLQLACYFFCQMLAVNMTSQKDFDLFH